MYKQYVGLVRDHSASMRGLVQPAMADYNQVISSLKENSTKYNVDTIVSVAECGFDRTSSAKIVVNNSSVIALQPLYSYQALGHGTPLFDSVGLLIEAFKKVPDYNDPNVAFLISVVTDGAENASISYKYNFARTISELQNTDRWTFTFRVPFGYKRNLIHFSIPEFNIIEWEQTVRGMETATQVTTSSFNNYYSERSVGTTSTKRFFANVGDLKIDDIKKTLNDISSQVRFFEVTSRTEIRPFIEKMIPGMNYVKGEAFYSLLKTETVQPNKQIIIRDKNTGAVYSGYEARKLIGLSSADNIRLSPGYYGNYEVFIQSTSVNRILAPGTKVLYWQRANAA